MSLEFGGSSVVRTDANNASRDFLDFSEFGQAAGAALISAEGCELKWR